MTTQTFETYPMTLAKIAGASYLTIAIFGAFSIGYVPSVIFADGDAATTSQNLSANMRLFRMGLFGDIVVLLVEVVLTCILYVLFKPVDRLLSLVAMVSRLLMVAVMAVLILLNTIVPVVLNAGDVPQAPDIVLLLLQAHGIGIFVWQLFFGLHLIFLGFLLLKSDLFPKIFGWLMTVGSLGYSLQGIAKITAFENAVVNWFIIALLIVVTIGELSFAIWLLFKGMNIQTWEKAQYSAAPLPE